MKVLKEFKLGNRLYGKGDTFASKDKAQTAALVNGGYIGQVADARTKAKKDANKDAKGAK